MAVPTHSKLDCMVFDLTCHFSAFMKNTKQMQETEMQVCEMAIAVHKVLNNPII